VLDLEGVDVQGAAHDEAEVVQVDGLAEEVVGALADRFEALAFSPGR